MTSRGPGLTKIRCLWPTATKEKRFHRATPALVRAWLDQADVVSEGATEEREYFGSTQIRLPWASAPHPAMRDQRATDALESDPHLRVFALRIARREATSRCLGVLHVMRADLSFSTDPVGFVIVIDVDARVVSTSTSALHS